MVHDHSWHVLTAEDSAIRLGSDPRHGLSEDEAKRRLAAHGPNRLPQPKPRPLWRMVLDQFASLLTLVLLAAGVLAGLVGDTTDMAVILVVVVFNAGLGFYQEFRAERILDTLKSMLAQQARLRRSGVKIELPAEELVAGDVVLLEAGDRIPADGRLIAAHSLEVDESSLTGESVAVAKNTAALDDSQAPLAERINQAFMNCVVTRGRGEMLVTATGPATEMGRIAHLLNAAHDGQTPLQARLDQLGRRLAMIAGLVVGVILVMGLMRGEPLAATVLTAVALAVAAIPEGLPAVVTITLAIGMYRMARRGAIVKRLSAVETLGSTTVIGSDKTGTLTLNQMTAKEVWAAGRIFPVEGEGYGPAGRVMADLDLAPFLRAAWACNDSHLDGQGADRRVVGDATEGALKVLAEKAGAMPHWPRLAELPFDAARRLMITLHRDGDRVRVMVKGGVDEVMACCRHIRLDQGDAPLDAAWRELALRENDRLAGHAMRVIALAEGEAAEGTDPLDACRDLTLTALVGLMDPPRPSAAGGIAACKRAGIAVKMITGDHRITAAAIGRMLGLDGEVVTGADLDRMDEAALANRIDDIAIFARVSPEHKLRIVQALKERGHVVAMTGDGVNDAAALRGAHMGIAMGRTGCDVTREAATMVLTDDDFATVVGAVTEGRVIYDNIVKFVRFQLSTNVGALLAVFAAPFLGLPIPFHPIQILWVNIIMDGPPALALAFDPARPGLMEEKPRPRDEPILSWHRLLRLGAYGLTMAVGTLGVLAWGLTHGDPARAGTLAFTTFVLFQVFNVFNARVGAQSVFSPSLFRNAKLWAALAAVVSLQALAVHWSPAQALFHTQPLESSDWMLAFGVASMVLFLDEARKALRRLMISPQTEGV